MTTTQRATLTTARKDHTEAGLTTYATFSRRTGLLYITSSDPDRFPMVIVDWDGAIVEDGY